MKKKYDKTGLVQISVSMPGRLADKIAKMAAAENRNRSNYIANAMERLSRDFDAAQAAEKGARNG